MRHSTFSHNLVFLSNFCTDLSSRFRAVLVPFSSHSRAIIEGKHVLKGVGRFVATLILLFSLATGHAWGANGDVLFTQNFNSAGEVAYAQNQARAYTTTATLSNCVGSGDNLFTSITCNAKNTCGIGINSVTGGNSKSYSGKFGVYYNNTGGYWSIVRTSNLAATAPTALKVEMTASFAYVSSGSNIGVQFAVGSGFTDGVTNSCPALTACVAGFALPSNSTIRVAKYATSNGNTAINGSSATLTNEATNTFTWVINNTSETLTYSDPAGGSSTVAAGCWDLWVGTSRNLAGVTKATTGMSGSTLQNLYIGSPFGKKHEFILDDITITDLTPTAPSCPTPTASRGGTEATPAGGVTLGTVLEPLTCTATGTSVTYQWKQNTIGSKDGAVNAIGTGATTASFVPNPAAAGSYWYYCVVTDACSNTVETSLSGVFQFNTPPTHTVTVNVNNALYGSASAAESTVAENGTTTITATPSSGYVFDHWTVSGTGAMLSSTTTNPTTLTMGTADATVTAYFEESTCPTSGTLYSAVVVATSTQSLSSNSNITIPSNYATITGGSMIFYNVTDGTKDYIKDQSSTFYFCESANTTVFKAVLDCPLAVGDVITVDCYSGGNTRGIWVSTAASRPGSAPACAGTINQSGAGQVINYTVAAGSEFIGATELYFYRATSNTTYFNNINITRPAPKIDATVYSFSNGTFNSWANCDGGTLTLAGSQSGVSYQLYKDEVATGSPVAGTGSALNFTVTASGTYTVKSVANATYNQTDMTGSAEVTIQDPTPVGASIVEVGHTITLTHPNDEAVGTWSSSDNSVATVTSAGVVEGVTVGTATITFQGTDDCSKSKEITVYDASASYIVTYDGNGSTGGSVPVDASSPYTSGATVTVLGNTGSLVKTGGYAFAGWNTAANGSGISYAPGATFTITANTTLYAQWRNTSGCNTYKYVWKVTGNFCDDESTATASVSMFSNNDRLTLTGSGHRQQSGSSFDLNKTAGNYFLFTAQTGFMITSICFYGKIEDASVYKTTDGTDWSSTITSTNTGGDAYYSFDDINATHFGIKLSGTSGIWIRNMVIEVCPTADPIYTVTYNGNGSEGGSVPVDANSPYAYGSTVTVLGNTGTLTKSLYRFDGWNTAADGSGADFAASSTFTITKDTTLYAKWVPDCTDPVVTTQPSNYSMVHGGTALLACAADKGTYQWYNATDNTAAGTGAAGTPVSVGSGYNAGGWTTPTISTNGEYQYYCVITDGLCSVTTNTVTLSVTDPPTPATAIDINGATEIHPGQSTVLSVTYTPANANTDTVLTWTSSDPSIATVNKGTVTGVALGTVTITATTANGKSDTHTINVVPITVTLNANGGSVTPGQLIYGGAPLILPTPTRAGYACLGWYTASAGGTLVSSPYSPTASITLYAHWETTALTLHTPGVYETTYGQTLTTYSGEKYEVYGFTSTGSNVNYLWAGTPTTDETDDNCMMKFAAQTEVTREWISQEMHGRGSSGSMSSAEFVASGVYAMNYRDDRPLQIRIKGFESFAIYGSDANATKATEKYLQVLVNGVEVTDNLSTSLTVRRYALDKNTEYLIVVKGIGGSNNALWGFSLQVPDCTPPTLEWATTPNETVVKETSATATVTTNYPAGVTYTSSDPSVMTVTGNGTTTASLNFLTAGTVTLTAQVTGDDGTYCNSPVYITKTFTVLNDPIPATAISLEDVAIEVGESLQLVPTWTPANATNAETSGYVTGSTDIATVTASGMLTGVAVGRTTVTVTSVSGLTATANVIVRPAAIPCETWEGTPAAWSGGQMTIGELVLTGSTTIGTAGAYDNISATIINVDSKGVFIEGYFAEGYEIGSLSLGVSRNSSTTSTCEYALILSPSSTFSASSIQVILPSVAGYNMPRDVQTFNIPAGMKHFRIYRQSTEFGATYGDNQSIRIYHIEACPVTPCNEKAGTIALTGNAEDCPGTNRTLTLSGYEPGADIQWYRDGNPVSGATNPTLTTSVPGDYYAVTMNACEKRSTNSITLSDMPDPSATALLDYIYVKNGRPVQIDLFRFEGGSSWSVTPAISGCTYTEEDGVIHLSGTPVIGSNSNTTMTLTVNNSCTGSSATATLTLHLLASTAKPTLAYVVTGTKNGGWTAANSEGTALSTFLSAYYDVTVVNGYASNNEPKIKAYYSQYDVILMTDYPDTNIKPDNNTEGAGGRSYTNAIGCLIDIKPILTLETFVSKLDNWQISSDPKNTSSVRKMTVLCTAHNIFEETLFEGDNADEITILSGGTMQGFEPIYAPNYMFISTIDNGGETLVNCCERQIVVGARMILLGIQHEAMGSITDKGKTVIHNIIQYLLETDPNGLADCAIVFDDNHNTHVWSDAANWGPAHNRVPTPYQAVRILKPCTVDINNAAASSIKLNKENGHNGSITIQPNASLSVIGTIREVHGNNYITTYPVAAADLVIQANATNQGALAHGDEDGLTHATVQFYARGKNAPLSTTDWQYMGTPFSDVAHAIDHYENSWMCRWNEDTEGFGGTNWEWVTTSDPLIPFTGYALAQNSAKTFEFTGTLVPSVKKTLTLTSGGGDWKGWNLFANSWMAPINIRQFETSDFGSAEATIYLFNTGYRTIDDVSSASASETSGAGQYVAVPIASAGSMAESARYIPPMQGFYIYTSTSAAVTLDYNKLIYTSNFTNSTRPNRAPRRALQDEETQMPRVMIDVKGSRYTDRLYLFENPDLTNDFDNAWDGHKFEGDELAPQIMTRTGDLDLAVDASPSFGGKRIAFRAGEDTEYTLYFSTTVSGLRLRDLQTGAETDIIEGGHYSFTASNSTIEERFEIGDYRPTTEVPTGLEETQYDYGNDVLELSIYTTDGKLLLHRTTDFKAPIVLPQSGVYIVKLRTTAGTQVLKRIF